jgi:hypothetical protein
MEKAPKRRRPISPRPKGKIKNFPIKENSGPTWPRFVIIRSIKESELAQASPFVINRAITTMIGSPDKIKKLRDGSLLIQTNSERQSNTLLNANTLAGNISIICEKHSTLNIKKGIIHCPEISSLTEKTICEELADQGVVEVRRIVRRSPASQASPHTFTASALKSTAFHRS